MFPSALLRWHRSAFVKDAFVSRVAAICILILLILVTMASAQDQDRTRRLILKDGSYQLVAKYEVKGDRVRYLSTEREEWEELPNSLVDWPATEKFEKERETTSASAAAVQLDKEAAHEAEAEETPLPQVAPGLRLPEDSGVFMLDSFGGEAQLVEIPQNTGDVNQNVKGNIFRSAIPLAGVKMTVELDRAHANLQSHVGVPSLYIKLDDMPDASRSESSGRVAQSSSQPQQPQQPEKAVVPFDQFHIVRAEVKNGKRIVLDLKRGPDGKVNQQHFVKSTIDRVTGGWLKLTPTEPLAPGEYALVEMVSKEGVSLEVWDFGVNPKAPANTNPWKPERKKTEIDTASPSQPAK
jgi:hypothetical protein